MKSRLLFLCTVLLAGCLQDLSEHTLPPIGEDTSGEVGRPDGMGPTDAGGDFEPRRDTPDVPDATSDDVEVDMEPDVRVDMGPDMPECMAESDEEFCANNRANCGELTATDQCGLERTVNCGACISPNTCGGGEFDNVCGCSPLSAEQYCGVVGAACGTVSGNDICGSPRTADCGTCDVDEVCSGNICVCDPETDAELCTAAGANCGELTATDRCGAERTVDCGTCQAPESCGGDPSMTPNVCGCTPESDPDFCMRHVANCGDVTAEDNCGAQRTVNCGPQDCDDPTGAVTCGGGGTPNVCACSTQSDAEFCTDNNAECGALTAPDDCGNDRTVNCGSCNGFETCGGGGVANECGCMPESDSAFCTRTGAECGSVTDTDNCGVDRTVDCGTCGSDEQCGVVSPNVCDCVPDDRPTFCMANGAECGQLQATDNCGNTRTENCGGCAAGETCDMNICVCQPETDAQFCSRLNGCGMVTANDNCGTERTVDCQTCDTGNCIDNTCTDCTPETDGEFCSRLGIACGPASGTDNCGSSRSVSECGPCPSDPGVECQSGTCVCIGESDSELCTADGAECGSITVTDQCGDSRTVSCGTCTSPDECQSNQCVCEPKSVSEFCSDNGAECGSFTGTDQCGNSRTEDCGGCGLQLVCKSDNTCGAL